MGNTKAERHVELENEKLRKNKTGISRRKDDVELKRRGGVREPDLFLYVFIVGKDRPKKGNGGGSPCDLSHNESCTKWIDKPFIIKLLMTFVFVSWNIFYNCLRLPMLT